MSYPKTYILNRWPAEAEETCEGEECEKEVLNHLPPGAAPDKVGKPSVWEKALLQFILWKSMLCVGSPACAFAGIKMLCRCKGDGKANRLPQDYYLVRCLTFFQHGVCHPPFGQGPYAVLLLFWMPCCPEAARVHRTEGSCSCTSHVPQGMLDPCRHPDSLVILLIN